MTPDTKLPFLGFDIDSVSMLISLTQDKKEKLFCVIRNLCNQDRPSIREVAGLIGLMVTYTPGAHFKALENDKIRALRRRK